VVKEWAELSTRFGPGAGVDVAAPLALEGGLTVGNRILHSPYEHHEESMR
jgi:hypothetical protein